MSRTSLPQQGSLRHQLQSALIPSGLKPLYALVNCLVRLSQRYRINTSLLHRLCAFGLKRSKSLQPLRLLLWR